MPPRAHIQRTVDSHLGNTTNVIISNHLLLVPRMAQWTCKAQKRDVTDAAELKFRDRRTS